MTTLDPALQATLPGRAYVDPAVFDAECEHILEAGWFCAVAAADADVTRSSDLRDGEDAVEQAAHLELAGLMCVPPLGSDPAQVFARARELADRLGERMGRTMTLSAGMSADLEDAICAGSDIVRVGTGVLGERKLP